MGQTSAWCARRRARHAERKRQTYTHRDADAAAAQRARDAQHQRNSRTRRSEEESAARRAQDAARKRHARASRSEQSAATQREQDAARKRHARASRSEQTAAAQREQNAARMRHARAAQATGVNPREQFWRAAPPKSLEPKCIDPATGSVYRCQFCNAPLFQNEAASTRKTPCCADGRLAHLTFAEHQPSANKLAIMHDPRWPFLSRQVNAACTFANTCIVQPLTHGGRGIHQVQTAHPKALRLEGKVMYYFQRANEVATGVVHSLCRAAKGWWTVASVDGRGGAMSTTADDDLRELIERMRAELKTSHQLCRTTAAQPGGAHDGAHDNAQDTPAFQTEFQHRPPTSEVMVVHDNDEPGYHGPPAPEYRDSSGRQLLPGEADSVAFPVLFDKPPYDVSQRGTGPQQATQRKWAKRVMHVGLPQLLRSPQLAQEWVLSKWSQIEDFALRGVRMQQERLMRNPARHSWREQDDEDEDNSMPTTYAGVQPELTVCAVSCPARVSRTERHRDIFTSSD